MARNIHPHNSNHRCHCLVSTVSYGTWQLSWTFSGTRGQWPFCHHHEFIWQLLNLYLLDTKRIHHSGFVWKSVSGFHWLSILGLVHFPNIPGIFISADKKQKNTPVANKIQPNLYDYELKEYVSINVRKVIDGQWWNYHQCCVISRPVSHFLWLF